MAVKRTNVELVPDLSYGRMWSLAQSLAFSIKLGLRKGLKRVCLRRALTDEQEQCVANEIVDYLKLANWKFEQGPPVEGHGANIIAEQRSGIGLRCERCGCADLRDEISASARETLPSALGVPR